MEERIGKRINTERIDEALGTDPDTISTGCPYCMVMLGDAVSAKKSYGRGQGVAGGRRRGPAAGPVGRPAGRGARGAAGRPSRLGPRPGLSMDSRRAEAFSDGVFAVAITVLVFNLLPIGSRDLAAHPYHVLLSAWPQYLAYAVSFLTIGIMWVNHHAMFAAITMVDRRLLSQPDPADGRRGHPVPDRPGRRAAGGPSGRDRAGRHRRGQLGRAGGRGGLRRGHGRDLDRLLGACGMYIASHPGAAGRRAARWSGPGWRTCSSARACSATSRPR